MKKIELKKMEVDEPIQLSILKSKFNRIATGLNFPSHNLSQKEQEELVNNLALLEKQITTYHEPN